MDQLQKNAVFVAKTWKPPEDWSSVYLRPGEYIVSDGSPLLVSTVLGSCVSVTMFAPALGVGAITHGVLPCSCGKYGKAAQGTGRFVDASIHAIVQELRGLGVKPSQTEVKVFGGSQMYGQWGEGGGLRIGWENVEAALNVLSELGYSVLATDVGGNRGRKLLFVSHTGEVWVKKLSRPVHNDEVKHEQIPD
jgi:chemotaxis protein CheD